MREICSKKQLKPYINSDELVIRYKRVLDVDDTIGDNRDTHTQSGDPEDNTDTPSGDPNDINKLFSAVLQQFADIGRENDFLSLLQCVADGRLDINNIALHLILDMGQFLSKTKVNSMRYSNVTLDFWLLVARLFKGKALRFFRGFMADGQKESVQEGIL